MLVWLGALFLLGFAAEFASDAYGILYIGAASGRYRGVSEERMRGRVKRARRAGLVLFGLSQVDTGSVLGGWDSYLTVAAGASIGSQCGTHFAMWYRWREKNGVPHPMWVRRIQRVLSAVSAVLARMKRKRREGAG